MVKCSLSSFRQPNVIKIPSPSDICPISRWSSLIVHLQWTVDLAKARVPVPL